jgi:hypothetical protein
MASKRKNKNFDRRRMKRAENKNDGRDIMLGKVARRGWGTGVTK